MRTERSDVTLDIVWSTFFIQLVAFLILYLAA